MGIIKRVDYPKWLANPVVVLKHNDDLRMCIDYTYLNKAIPEKLFPLPLIDKVVDPVASHAILDNTEPVPHLIYDDACVPLGHFVEVSQ